MPTSLPDIDSSRSGCGCAVRAGGGRDLSAVALFILWPVLRLRSTSCLFLGLAARSPSGLLRFLCEAGAVKKDDIPPAYCDMLK